MSFSHAAFAPYATLVEALGLKYGLPSLDALNAQANALETRQAHGLPLRFAEPEASLSAREYETQILETGFVPTRVDTWHDVLNALVWLRFPRFKAALNAAHGAALATEAGTQRGRRRDAMTVLDESGVWVTSSEPGLDALLVGRAWSELFWAQRARVEASMTFVVVGHALLEKALRPYASMTGKCLIVDAARSNLGETEVRAVEALDAIESPRALAPLPIQGIPGWDPANDEPGYYDNVEVFRPPAPRDPGRFN